MISQALLVLISALVLLPLVEGSPLLHLAMPMGLLALVLLAQHLQREEVREWSSTGLVGLVALPVAMLPVLLLDGGSALACQVAGGLLLLLILARRRPWLQLALALAGPLVPIVFAMEVAQQRPAACLLAAWWAASTPVLAIFIDHRRWPALLPSTLAGTGLVLLALGRNAALGANDLLPLTARLWSSGGDLLAIGQCLLVGLGILPLVLRADPRWRFLTVLGLALSLGTLAITAAAGPWTDGAPLVALGLAILGGLTAIVGLSGMLCTVRRPDILAEAAYRALVLGLGACAALAGALAERGLPGTGTLAALAAVLSPLAWGLALSGLLLVATLVAGRQRQTAALDTEGFQASLRHSVVVAGQRLSALARRLRGSVHEDARSWLHAQGLVPAMILASTASVFSGLGAAAVAPALVLACIPSRSMARVSMALWVCWQVALAMAFGWCFALPLAGILGLSALMLLTNLPFAGRPTFGQGWAFPTFVVALAATTAVLDLPGLPAPIAMLTAGVTVLTANLLLPGQARVPVLMLQLVVLVGFLFHWVPDRDPYASVQLLRFGSLSDLAGLVLRLPFVALPLLALWVSRERYRRALPFGGWSLLLRVLLPAMASLLVWITMPQLIGHWSSAVAWLVLLQAMPVIIDELRQAPLSGVVAPLTDAMAVAIAILLLTLGQAAELVAERVQAGGHGRLPAGSLGSLLVAAVLDIGAIILTGAVLLLGRWLIHVRRGMAGAVLATARFTRERSSSLVRRLVGSRRKGAADAVQADRKSRPRLGLRPEKKSLGSR